MDIIDDSAPQPAPTEKPEVAETPVVTSPREYRATVSITDDVLKPGTVKGPKLSMLYTTLSGFTEFSERTQSTRAFYQPEWAVAIQNGAGTSVLNDGLEGLMKRNADWAQHVEVEGMKLRAGKPGIAKSAQGNVLIGQQAISRITALTSAGTIVKVPLWHSGIWISIKAPQLSAWVELEKRVALEKVLAGRNTRGLVFSNDSVFMVNHIVDFVLNHVFDSTLQNWTADLLRKVIRSPDLGFLVTGMALTVFPEGHPYSQPCTKDASVCQHVAEGIINLSKVMWVDRQSLTEKQRKHMLKRDKSHTLEEIELYQSEWLETKMQTRAINDSLKVVFKVPSLEEQIEMGTAWIGRIEEATESAFGANLRGQQREAYIAEQTEATRIGLYVHWIDKFIITDGDDEQIVEDRDTIEEVALTLSGSPDVADTVIKGVGEFINVRTISCIGIPNYECPNCKGWHLTEEGPMKSIIPIDAVATFFTLLQSLLTSRLQRLD